MRSDALVVDVAGYAPPDVGRARHYQQGPPSPGC